MNADPFKRLIAWGVLVGMVAGIAIVLGGVALNTDRVLGATLIIGGMFLSLWFKDWLQGWVRYFRLKEELAEEESSNERA